MAAGGTTTQGQSRQRVGVAGWQAGRQKHTRSATAAHTCKAPQPHHPATTYGVLPPPGVLAPAPAPPAPDSDASSTAASVEGRCFSTFMASFLDRPAWGANDARVGMSPTWALNLVRHRARGVSRGGTRADRHAAAMPRTVPPARPWTRSSDQPLTRPPPGGVMPSHSTDRLQAAA